MAESTVAELEAKAQHVPPLTTLAGEYDPPNDAYQWKVETHPLSLEGLQPQTMAEVLLTVSRRDDRPPVVRLHTVWPSKWLVIGDR